MKNALAIITLFACLTASGAEFGTVNGTVGTFTALTNAGSPVLKASDTNGWDVSAGGGGGGNTNWYAEVYCASNQPIFVHSVWSNLMHDAEISDVHNIYDPVLFAITPPAFGFLTVHVDFTLDDSTGLDTGGIAITTNGIYPSGATERLKFVNSSILSGSILETLSWRHEDAAVSNYSVWVYQQYGSTRHSVTGLVGQADSDMPSKMVIQFQTETL